MRSILLPLAGCFTLGIVLARPGHASTSALHAPGLAWIIPALLVLAGLCLLVGLAALRARRLRVSALLALAGFVFAGALSERLFEVRFPTDHLSHLESWGIDLGQPVRLEGRLASEPQRTPFGSQFDLEATRLEVGEDPESPARVRPVSGKVRLQLAVPGDPEAQAAAEALRLQDGDAIRALVELRQPRVYRNPGSFDFRRRMESIEDVYWLGSIKSPLLVEKLRPVEPAGPARPTEGRRPSPVPDAIARLLQRARQRLLESIDRLYPPWLPEGRDGAVLKAVLLGDRSSLDSDTIESFRKVGLYHLLVIAGLHVGLLVMLVEMLLRRLALGETWRSAIALLFLACFALLVEQRAPTLRATLMISVYLLARIFYRSRAALNSIGLAALVLLVLRPAWLFDSGFELSFAAALLIGGLAVPILDRTTEPYRRALWQLDALELDPSLEPRASQFRLDLRSLIGALKARSRFFERHPSIAESAVTAPARLVLWAANMVLFSTVLQFGLLLPMAQTFHRVSYAGIGLNALAVPVMIVLLAAALPTVMLGAVSPALAMWPAKVLDAIMKGLFALTDLPHLPHWLSYRVPSPPEWVAWGFAISIVVAAWALGRFRWAAWSALAAAAVFAALISVYPFQPRLPSGEVEITVLDCGGGGAAFVVLPDRTTMLVGAGGGRSGSRRQDVFQRRRWDGGEEIVSPYLWSRGIKKIDILVVSSDRDRQLGGFDAVTANFSVGEVWHGSEPSSEGQDLSPDYEALLDRLRARGVSEREVAAGGLMAAGGARVQVLWPNAQARVDDPRTRRQTRSRPSQGDDSLVLRISSGEASVLLAGDIGERVERQLASSATPLGSQVLEVARLGGRSSSTAEFLTRVAPRIAILAANRDDRKRSPGPETLDYGRGLGEAAASTFDARSIGRVVLLPGQAAPVSRPEGTGARLFRTDRDGAVTVEMRGGSLAVRGFVEGR